jgi:hypothetical protein
MLQPLRARRYLALATLAAFLLAQPAVGCAALCLFERHVAGGHMMPGMNQGSKILTNSACHPTATGTVQRAPFQVLPPMQPASAPVIAVAPDRWIEPVWTLPTAPRLISPKLEPPPPRLA